MVILKDRKIAMNSNQYTNNHLHGMQALEKREEERKRESEERERGEKRVEEEYTSPKREAIRTEA